MLFNGIMKLLKHADKENSWILKIKMSWVELITIVGILPFISGETKTSFCATFYKFWWTDEFIIKMSLEKIMNKIHAFFKVVVLQKCFVL